MPFAISCPKCGKSYTLDDKHAGRKVACSRKSCGEIFIANVPGPTPAQVEDDVFLEGFEEFAEIPESPSRKPPDFPVLETHVSAASRIKGSCYLSSIGQILFFIGFSAIVAGLGLPCTIDRQGSGYGEFSIPAGEFFNMPLAMAKLSSLLFGMPLMISGAVFWSAGKKPPGFIAFVLVALELAAAVFVTILQLR